MSLRKYADQPRPRGSKVIFFDKSFFVFHAKPDANILGRTLMQNPVIIASKARAWRKLFQDDWTDLMVGQALLLGEVMVCVEDLEDEWKPIEVKLKALFDAPLDIAEAKGTTEKENAQKDAESLREARAAAIIDAWLLPKGIDDVPRYDESELAKSIGPHPELYTMLIGAGFEMAGLSKPEDRFDAKELSSDVVLRVAAGNSESEEVSGQALSSGASSPPADTPTS